MAAAVLGGKSTTEGGPDYTIKPQATAPAIDTSEWPLLLKHYDRCMTARTFFLKTILTIRSCSTCPNWPFRSYSSWLYAIEERLEAIC